MTIWDDLAHAETSWDAAHWGNRQSQAVRFHAAAKHLPENHGLLLDYGCGTGDFHRYARNWTYVGCDLSRPMLARARADHPGVSFLHVDELGDTRYHAVVAIGVWNLASEYSKPAALGALEELYRHRLADGGRLIASVLRLPALDIDAVWFNVQELAAFAHHLTDRWLLDCTHHDRDAILVLEKPDPEPGRLGSA